MSLRISIIIPTYNGRHLLERTLRQNIESLLNIPNIEWIVSDDCSTDDTEKWIQKNHPEVKFIKSDRNRGFGYTAHQGALAAIGDVLFFLNNDMKIIETSLDTIFTHLRQTDIFAIVPEIIRPSKNNALESITWGFFKGGWLSAESYIPDDAIVANPQPILWACGGAMWVTRTRYFELGGFDPMFLPFYFEDLDLSYRAWQRGWKCLYVPTSGLVHHDHQATISTIYSKKIVERIHRRHHYLFIWKNISTPKYLASHLLTVLLKIITFQMHDIFAIFGASKSIATIIKYRRNRPKPILTDQTIFSAGIGRTTGKK